MRVLLLLALLALAAAGGEMDKARAIAKAGPEAAKAAIPEMIALGKGTVEERFAARDALVVAGPHAVVPLVEGASGDAALRLLLEGVSHDLGAAVVAPALPLLSSEDPKVRAAAAICLGAAGEGGEAAVKKLIEAVYDKDKAVRREAATALGRIGRGAHDAVPALILLADDRERDATRDGILALGMILRDAAERARPAPNVTPEVAGAIEKGLAWLMRQQHTEGWWEVSAGIYDPEKPPAANERTRIVAVASLALFASLESGTRDRYLPEVRRALRYLIAAGIHAGDKDDGVPWPTARVAATLCAATRMLGEPECCAAAQRAIGALRSGDEPDRDAGWRSVALLEADFAGIPFDPPLRSLIDTRPPEGALLHEMPEWRLFQARAKSYAGEKPEPKCPQQQEDGGWEGLPGSWGRAHTTACMLLALEAASGLAHPLTMPLPDAPQLKAAVLTLQLAARSSEPEIRTAAEQALAGFAVR